MQKGENFYDYNAAHVHERDGRISFEPGEHKYVVDGTIACESVTELVGNCFEKFDADYWAERKATPTVTAEQIKAQWERKGEIARILGTQLHDRIEHHYLGYVPDDEALAEPGFRHFLRFAERHKLHPYRSEWPIFMEEYGLAGTLDFLTFDGEKYEIYDWKRSTKVVDNYGTLRTDSFGKRALAPIDSLPDTTYHHYALQLSFYRYILAQKYGIEVSACHLGVFHPDLPDYYLVDVPYLLDEVKAILATRR